MDNKQLTTFYIVRHGQTDWNFKKLFQGQKDIPLNSVGEQQALEAAGELRNIRFDKVFASDMLRAKRTAEIIALEHKLAVETTKLLRERQLGKFEGKPVMNLKKLTEEYIKLNEKAKEAYRSEHNIEDTEEAIARFITFLREVALANPGKTVLTVTHGGMMCMLLAHLGFYKDKITFAFAGRIENAGYIKLSSDGIDFFIQKIKGIHKEGRSSI